MQYDEFQKKAIEFINQGTSVIVSAPTGSGKTVIAEHVLRDCLNRKTKVIYTAPIKALSNQKYRDFEGQFAGQVGILTGDVTINAQASCLIMTTEIFRNKILEERSSLADYSWIIFDEIHFLDDIERGSVWEESLIFLPEHMNLLGLSATVPNIRELAKWLETIHKRPIEIIEETKRPVPLHMFYQCQGEIYDNFEELSKKGFRKVQSYFNKGQKFIKPGSVRPNKPIPLIRYLQEEDMLPCIYFVFSRRRTEVLADEARGLDFLNDEEKSRIKQIFEELCVRFDLVNEPSAEKIKPLILHGIAYHHAGMLPTLKEVVERLFTSRLIKVIFTTETFALGINMPARTVVFDELRKFYGTYFGPVKTRDFYQMAGRAGRRSIDTEGFVFCRVHPGFMSISQLHKIIFGKPEQVLSRFNASYATILNLYQKFNEKLYDIYPFSFHYFQESRHSRTKALGVLQSKVNLLKELGYIAKGQLSAKGIFASHVYGYELILTELNDAGTLEELSETELGVLAAAVVFEPRKDSTVPILPPSIKRLQTVTVKLIRQIHRAERDFGLKTLSKPCYFHLAAAVEEWMRGGDFESMLRKTDVDEGEVVRYFRMTIQILREIIESPVSTQLQLKIRRAISQLNRDVIDAEKQLRGS